MIGPKARKPGEFGFWLPWHMKAPSGGSYTSKWSDPNNPYTAEREEYVAVFDPRDHKEKATAVLGVIDGVEITVVGGGEEWTEDLKDKIERMAEDDRKNAAERAREAYERRERFRAQAIDYFDAKTEYHEKNWRTDPGPNRENDGEKKLF